MTDERIQRIGKRLRENKDGSYRLQLIRTRFCIRHTLTEYNHVVKELSGWQHQKRKLHENVGGIKVTFPLMDAQIARLKERQKHCRNALISQGELTIALVDLWQEEGADFDSLCDLCGRPRHVIEKLLYGEDPAGRRLSQLLCSAGLDYYDNGSGFYEYTQDGPFSHATKEFLLDRMLHTERGRIAAHEAMEEIFPEIMEGALYLREDEFGEQCLYDKDGNLVAEGVAFEKEGD